MKIKYTLLLSISAVIIALDQITKILIMTQFYLGETKAIIPGFFNLTYVHNTGAAFGVFAEAHPTFRAIFFLSVPPLAVLWILWELKHVAEAEKAKILALSLICAGAIGNYIDRLRFRYVIDFLDFHYKNVYSYPAFNVADSSIVVGVILYLLISVYFENRKKIVS